MKRVGLFVIALGLPLQIFGKWTIDTVATITAEPRGVDIALDASTNPHILYTLNGSATAYEKFEFKNP